MRSISSHQYARPFAIPFHDFSPFYDCFFTLIEHQYSQTYLYSIKFFLNVRPNFFQKKKKFLNRNFVRTTLNGRSLKIIPTIFCQVECNCSSKLFRANKSSWRVPLTNVETRMEIHSTYGRRA